VAQSVRLVDYLTTHISLSPIRRGLSPGFVNYKKGALNSQPQVIKFTVTFTNIDKTLTGEKEIQSNIEVANMCVQSNIPTDSVSLLYME
jgi:hypothetical protein